MTRQQLLTITHQILHNYPHLQIMTTRKKDNSYEMELVDTRTGTIRTVKHLIDWIKEN